MCFRAKHAPLLLDVAFCSIEFYFSYKQPNQRPGEPATTPRAFCGTYLHIGLTKVALLAIASPLMLNRGIQFKHWHGDEPVKERSVVSS